MIIIIFQTDNTGKSTRRPNRPGWAGRAGQALGWPPGWPAGRPPMKIFKNNLKMKESGPGTFIFEKSAKNYARDFNESF